MPLTAPNTVGAAVPPQHAGKGGHPRAETADYETPSTIPNIGFVPSTSKGAFKSRPDFGTAVDGRNPISERNSSDDAAPTLVSATPANGATDVAVTATVASTWNETLSPHSSAAITKVSTGESVDVVPIVSGDTITADVYTWVGFEKDTEYEVVFTARDMGGNTASLTRTFTTVAV